jgi:hypothetical protein
MPPSVVVGRIQQPLHATPDFVAGRRIAAVQQAVQRHCGLHRPARTPTRPRRIDVSPRGLTPTAVRILVIQEKLNTLKVNRETFVHEVNAQMAFLNGQIALLEDLLKPEEDKEGRKDEARDGRSIG